MTLILIVEDNPANRDMLSRRLIKKGFTIEMVFDGESAVNQTPVLLPDLILMDLSLPIMDGWEASSLIKNNPLTQHIPIIALTAHAMAEDREKALVSGCDDYDTKPVDLQRLLSKIEALLNP